ncbi:MAG TPA: ABC transporter permease [Candidatus Acidoferrales bacterium]|nr:ABC transporter permease [Candidatus Acidoferrales bacterium]
MNFFWRRKREGLKEELDSHLQMAAQERMARGEGVTHARQSARRELGNAALIRETTRDVWGWRWLETLLQDLRYALRMLRKTPVITGIALLSLALGIGANTAIFSLIDAVMLRMLPVQNPEQLAQIEFRSPTSPRPRPNVTNPIWEQVRSHQDVFSGVFAWSPQTFNLSVGGEVNKINGIYASGDYFSVLGVRPAAGRLMAASDDIRNCSGVAVLGYGFWQSHYGGAESAVGSSIRLNGHSFPIVGVAQRGFFGTDVGEKLDVAIPICAEATLAGKDSSLDVRDDWWLSMMGRLKPGMTIEQADARMKVLSPQLFGAVVPQVWPAKYQDAFRKYTFSIFPGASGTGGFYGLRQHYRQPLEILMFVVGLVLLIACANIASLLLARSAARQKEIAVRLALGASRGRLIRQVLTESIVLSGGGAILGVLFARWGSALLVRFVSTQQNQVFLDLKMDGRVLAFTIAITVLCGLLFGILPALGSTRVDAMSAMKEGQTQATGGRSHSSALRWIVAAQVALSLILLIGTGLFIRTFANLMTLDAGFDRNNVLMVQTNIHNAGIAEPARAPLYGQMLAKLRALPGVVSASQCWMTPLSGYQWDNSLTVPGHPLPAGIDPDTFLNWVTPGYFETMRTPLLEGRTFDSRDTATSTPVVIVNQLLARRYFGSQSPIGEHLMGGSEGMLRQPMEIIGVVQDTKYTSLQEHFQPEAYFPLSQIQKNVAEDSTFEIRTTMPPSVLIPAVRDAMASVNKLASLQFTTLKQEADDSVAQQHLMAVLSGFFGGLALLLTAIGLYGVMAYVVTLRTHEIGIRMALGAQRSSILRLVMRDAVIVLAAGIAAGLLGSIWITQLVKRLLFGLTPNDPVTIALAIAAIVMVAFVATYIPVRRAMKVDPMVALRYE